MRRTLGFFASVALVLSFAWVAPVQADSEDARVTEERARKAIEIVDNRYTSLDRRKSEIPERVREDFDDLMREARSDLQRAKRRLAGGDREGALEHAESASDGLADAEKLAPAEGGGR